MPAQLENLPLQENLQPLDETISALVDNQDTDLDLPRLLAAMQSNPAAAESLAAKWRNYHLQSSILRRQERQELGGSFHVDISARVSAQIQQELAQGLEQGLTQEQTAAKSLKPTSTAPSLSKQWLKGGALAASVMLMVIAGTQAYNFMLQPAEQAAVATFSSSASNPPASNQTTAPAQPVFSQAEPYCNQQSLLLTEASSRIANPCQQQKRTYSPLASRGLASKQAQLFTPVAAH